MGAEWAGLSLHLPLGPPDDVRALVMVGELAIDVVVLLIEPMTLINTLRIGVESWDMCASDIDKHKQAASKTLSRKNCQDNMH